MNKPIRIILFILFVISQSMGHYAFAVISPSLESKETIVLEYNIRCTQMGCPESNPCCNRCGGQWMLVKIKGADLSPETFCAGAYPQVVPDGKPLPECNVHNECDAKNCSMKNIEAVAQTEKPCTFHIQDWHFVEKSPSATENSEVFEEGGEADPGPEGPETKE